MKLIPPHIWNRKKPGEKGEAQVFDLLQEIQLSETCIALHSLNLAGGKKQAWSEIDFLIICNRAIIGVEVKAGRVKQKDGVWFVYDEFGNVAYKKYKSPLVQVSDAIEALRTGWFQNAYGRSFKGIAFVKTAVLCSNHRPDFAFEKGFPELQNEYVVYEEDLTADQLKARFNLAIDTHLAEAHVGRVAHFTNEQVEEISKDLRPDIDVSYASTASSNALVAEQQRLTEEQYEMVDRFVSFDRLVIDGGAGTGKTFLLIYNAMQEVSLGRSVLICSKSRLLIDFIGRQVGADVECLWYGKEPSANIKKYDVLLVDEGQDLCLPSFIDFAEQSLDRGLNVGRWRWFGDFKNQFDDCSEFDEDCFNYLVECTGNGSMFRLTRNVRNTPNIVQWLEQCCRARIGQTEVRGAGPEVRLINSTEIIDMLCGESIDPVYGEISNKEIVLLYVTASDLNVLPCLSSLKRRGVRIFEINEFKGLEGLVVFVFGLGGLNSNDRVRGFAYKSVSRGRNLVFVQSDNELTETILKIMREAQGRG